MLVRCYCPIHGTDSSKTLAKPFTICMAEFSRLKRKTCKTKSCDDLFEWTVMVGDKISDVHPEPMYIEGRKSGVRFYKY